LLNLGHHSYRQRAYENLIRNEGSALERGEWLLERKSIYEELFPETKVGGLPGAPGGGKQAKTAHCATFDCFPVRVGDYPSQNSKTFSRNLGSCPVCIAQA